jgi:protein gp37
MDIPLRWRRPRRIFVNSMSDLFHEGIPAEFVERVFDTMALARRHTFQVLTKRATRMCAFTQEQSWPVWPLPNVWLGVSVEDAARCERIAALRDSPAAVRFLSIEPLLGPVAHNLALDGIHWVIVGGESGPRSRPMDPTWVRDIRDLCVGRGVPFHFKQWGGTNKKAAGRVLDGRTWDEFPKGAKP